MFEPSQMDTFQAPPILRVIFYDLKPEYLKQQGPIDESGRRKQRVKNGIVNISIQTSQQIYGLFVWVKREIDLKVPIGPVAFPRECIKLVHKSMDKFEATVDLDSIYEDPETKQAVYKLDTGSTCKNMFKLIVKLQFVDESFSELYISDAFLLKTLRPPNPSTQATTSRISQEDDLKIKTVVADKGTFGHLVVREKFEIPKGRADIAYHVRLDDSDNSENFEEGDVVGFFEQTDGETYIKRLTSENKDKILHAGVISRSAYFEANRSDENDDCPTDTVCVLGIVKVKVVGSIQAGERVYASNAYPGKAVPQTHLLQGVGETKEVLLGMSIQSASPKELDEVLFVRCFICVILGVSSSETHEEISELYESQRIETKTEIKLASKRHCRRLCCCSVFFVLFLVLLGLTIYQVFAPGSYLRYLICRRHCITGHEFRYIFSPVRDPLGTYEAHGVEFTYDALREKISPHFLPKREVNTSNPQQDVTHYYLNVDRCAYGYAYGEVGNIFGGYRKIGGGKVFAINWNCTAIFWAAENRHWSSYSNTTPTLSCSPKMPYPV